MAGCPAGPLDGFGVGFWSGRFGWIVGCIDPGACSLFFGVGLGCSEVFVGLEANKKPTTEVMGFGYTTGPMVLVH